MISLGAFRRTRSDASGAQGLIAPEEWRRPAVRWGVGSTQALLLAGFLALFSLIYLRATRSWSAK